MGRIEDGLGMFARDRARAAIGIEKPEPERALALAHCLNHRRPLPLVGRDEPEVFHELRWRLDVVTSNLRK